MKIEHQWDSATPLVGHTVECPHCGAQTTPLLLKHSVHVKTDGLNTNHPQYQTHIVACSSCVMPFVRVRALNETIPSPTLGKPVKNLPAPIDELYQEARRTSSVGAHTGCAMLARKILMNLGVLEGAEENKSFQYYVDYLATNGYVPAKGRPWVDKIRQKGNEATHEIDLVSEEDAKDIMYLVENLLRFNFEMTGPT